VLKSKDIIALSLVSLLLFPIVLLGIMYALGAVRLEFGFDPAVGSELTAFVERYRPEQDLQDAEQSKLFLANQMRQRELDEREKRLTAELERLEQIKLENNRLKEDIRRYQVRIESSVEQSKELSDQRLKALAEVYGAMKPLEAAPILLSMDNQNIAKIIALIPEVRSQAKLMAAIGSMDFERAATITQILGWKTPR
jgi:flagellar motility protein MotE (MotC chaperone)